MVATVSPIATQAGLDAIRGGGNAVDAAIAAALMLGVVDGYNSGIGGGCFILIHTPDGKLYAIDGRETAPALAFRDFYRDENGKLQPTQSQTGARAVAVPGALLAYEQAVARHGKRKFADLLEPAAKVASDGFEITPLYSKRIRLTKDKIALFPATTALLLNEDGTPKAAGEVLRQPDLATTYRKIASEGTVDRFQLRYAIGCEQTVALCRKPILPAMKRLIVLRLRHSIVIILLLVFRRQVLEAFTSPRF